MRIVVIGLSHKTAPLYIRERVSFRDDYMHDYYRLVKTYPYIRESFILSTCNRVELYGAGYDVQKLADNLEGFIYRVHSMPAGCLQEYFYKKIDNQAIHHLFRVASGLDSMIIGENQILGQIKRAYGKAKYAGCVGFYLHKLLQDTLRTGKRVRSQTFISRGVTSIPGAALELVKKEAGIEKKKTLVVGVGKIGSMTVAKLAKLPVGEIVVLNRGKYRVESLKEKQNVRVGSLSSLRSELTLADIIIAATASPNYIITREMVEEVLDKKRRGILLIDLGMPRNIQGSVKIIDGVRLYNIEDLAPVIEDTIRSRAGEAEKAEEIIRDQLWEKSSLG